MIRAKIILTDEEFSKISMKQDLSDPLRVEDIYFTHPSFKKGQIIRARYIQEVKSASRTLLTHKITAITDDKMEAGLKTESVITSNPSFIIDILKMADFRECFRKVALIRNILYFHLLDIKLEYVQGIKALEIEFTGNDDNFNEAKERIIMAFAGILNIGRTEVESRFEVKDWKILLEEEEKTMELKETVSMMVDGDYKERFVAEYLQVKIRYDKLVAMCEDWDKGELKFTPTCSRETYDRQLKAMKDYLTVLEERALKESVKLPF